MTPKQRIFVREYFVDFNASAAAERAGYSKRTAGSQAHRLLQNVEIVEEIQRHVNARAKRLDATADRIVQENQRLATSDIRDVVSVGEDGVTVRPTDEWSDDAAAAVCEIMQTEKGGIRIKLHSKTTALALQARYVGLDRDAEFDRKKADDETRKILGL